MPILENTKSFLKPNSIKVILSIVILIYAFYELAIKPPYGHNSSPIPAIIFSSFGFFPLIFMIPYSYILACVVFALFEFLKNRKWLLIFAIPVSILLLGIDEPLVNNTVNRPDYSCSVDSDCVVKSISEGWCGNPQCVNQDWEYYDSVINSVFALSCGQPTYSCSCISNKCQTKQDILLEPINSSLP